MSLLPSTHNNSLKILRGVAHFQKLRSDGKYDASIALSPSAELGLNIAIEEATYISAEGGLNEPLSRDGISIERTMALTCNQISRQNFAMFMIGDLDTVSQTSSSVVDEETPYVLKNGSVQLGGTVNSGSGVFSVSAVTVSAYEGVHATARANSTAYVVGNVYVPATPNDHWYMCTVAGTSNSSAPTFNTSGGTFTDGGATFQDMGLIEYTADTDYELDTTHGIVHILNTGSIATAMDRIPASVTNTFRLSVDYTRAAKSFEQIASSSVQSVEGVLWFYEDNAKGENNRMQVVSAKIVPTGDYAFKSGQNYGAIQFQITAQKPATGSAIYYNGVPV